MQTVVIFTLFNILNYLDRFLVSALLPRIQSDLQISSSEAGLLASSFTIGYFICAPIFGYLGDRYPRPVLMTLGIFLWSLATLLTARADTFQEFLVARICVGVGEAGFGAVAPGFLKDRFKEPTRVNNVLSIFFSAIPVGAALGYVVGGLVASAYTWHAAFVLGGIPGLVGCWYLLSFKEGERQSVPVGSGFRSGLRELGQIRLLWYIIGGYALNTFALTGIATFVTSYGEQIGFELSEISSAFGMILVVSGFVGTFGGGRLASRIAAARKAELPTFVGLPGILALIATPFIGFAFITNNHTLFLSSCFIAELLIFAGTGPINSALVLSCPPHLVTMTQGVCIFAINLLGYLPSPYIIGLGAGEFGLAMSMQITTGMLFLSALVWIAGGMVAKRDANK